MYAVVGYALAMESVLPSAEHHVGKVWRGLWNACLCGNHASGGEACNGCCQERECEIAFHVRATWFSLPFVPLRIASGLGGLDC